MKHVLARAVSCSPRAPIAGTSKNQKQAGEFRITPESDLRDEMVRARVLALTVAGPLLAVTTSRRRWSAAKGHPSTAAA